jgi:hypothetical protein
VAASLLRYPQHGGWNSRGQSRRPEDSIIFNGHKVGIGLQLKKDVKFNVLLCQRSYHRFAQVVIWRTEGHARYSSSGLEPRLD